MYVTATHEVKALPLRKDFTFQAECKFTLKRGSQIDLCYYCIFNQDGNIDSVSITEALSICYIPIPFNIGVLKLESFSVNVIYSKK